MTAKESVISLSATHTMRPRRGEWVEVVRGEALVFAQMPDGRRSRLGSMFAGEGIAGCAPLEDGTELLLSGFPGTVVQLSDFRTTSHDTFTVPMCLVNSLIAMDGAPRMPASLGDEILRLPPGAHAAFSINDMRGVRWVSVRSGAVTFCEAMSMVVDEAWGPVPMSRDMWLTSMSDTQVTECASPDTADAWARSLDVLGRIALSAAVARQVAADAALSDRLRRDEETSESAIRESIDVLASSAGGVLTIPRLNDEHASLALAASIAAARADGLVVDERALERAVSDIETGRDAVAAVAEACGARPRAVTLSHGWQRREGRSLIAWRQGDAAGQQSSAGERATEPDPDDSSIPRDRTAVTLIWHRRRWSVVDPAIGSHAHLTADLAAQLLPEAIELVPVLSAGPQSMGNLSRLAARGSGRDAALVGVTTAFIAATAFFTPYFLGLLADLFTSEAPSQAYYALFGTLILVAIASAVWAVVRALGMLRIRSRSVAIASGSLWDRMLRQPVTWHNRQPLGDRMAQASAATNAAASITDDVLARLLDVAAIVGSLAAIATINITFLVAVGIVVIVQLLVTAWMLRVASRRASERVEASAAATGLLLEIMRAVNRIRVAGAESRVFLRWAQAQARYTRSDQALRRVSMYQGVVIAVWPILALAIVLVVSQLTHVSFGEFITAQTAAAVATGTVAATAIAASSGLIARRALDKARPLLEAEPESGEERAAPGVINGRIEALDLVFRYAPDRPPALDHVSLSIQPGEQVAIVGASGSGKTTLLRVLLGLETPESGVIRIDNQDLATLNAPAVRRQIGSVLQSSQLLPGPVRQNVDLGRGLTTAEIWAALDLAAVGSVVRAMPLGLDTPVTDGGGTISGGQRQRILIARALAGNPRIVMLDEATSALDNVTQSEVISALQRLRVTRVVIAHRLSTIRKADRVVVMSQGRVVAQGSYDELMAAPGPLRDLTERQQI